MNTLSKVYTAKFFATEDDYVAFRKHWATIVNDKNVQLTAAHHLLYLVLSGKDWRKGFTLPTNRNKLENGFRPEIFHALDTIYSNYREQSLLAPFAGMVTHEALLEARKLLYNPNSFYPGRDENGKYVREAYYAPVPAQVKA